MRALALALSLCLVAVPAAAQLTEAALHERIRAAEATPTSQSLIAAVDAARLLRDYDGARRHLDATWEATVPVFNGLVLNALLLPLASGEGVHATQRAFRDLRKTFHFTPAQISVWASNFPELLTGGEFDDVILRLSPDAEDPAYRCAGCWNAQAWVHRIAGRHDEAAALWARGVEQEPAGMSNPDPDVQAQARGQYARNLARAGRHEEARRHLELSMAMDVSDEALPAVRRRWAQTYAELGDAAGAVEHLEPLLEAHTLVTVHTLASREAWAGIRNDPAFQALLARHRGHGSR